jgi:hypothetical protein
MKQEPDIVVKGARLFFGLIATLLILLAALMYFAVAGFPSWDFQMPCPKQEQSEP